MNNTKNNTLTESAASLLLKLAAMATSEKGKLRAKFICTDVLTKQENGAMTSLKKKGLLSTELLVGEDGDKTLQVTLSKEGRAAIRALQTPPAVEEPVEEVETAAPKRAAKRAKREAAADTGEQPARPRVNAGVQAMFDPLPEAGTTLSKLYKGSCYQATLHADGSCELNDGTWYSSLTAAARHITGAKNISGRKFFGCAGKRLAAAE